MKGLQIPERYTKTLYVVVYSDPESCLYGLIDTQDFEPQENTHLILLATVDVDVPLDSAHNTLNRQVAQLERSRKKILSEATNKAGQIEEAIKSLQAIEYKGATA
jgi:hypothetical protein